MFVVVNREYGGYGLSEAAYRFLGLEWDELGFAFERDRANPKLVECVRALGAAANGDYAQLEVIEIPDDVKWHIKEHAGKEWIAEDHRTWGLITRVG